MYFKNIKLKKLLASSLVIASLFGSFGVGTLLGYSINDKTKISFDGSGLETSTIQSGIKVQSLSTATLDTGEMVKSFSYSVEPENATNQEITASLSWNKTLTSSDFGYRKDVNDYISFKINKDTKTIDVTCKQPFGTQIALNLISVDNPNAKAVVTCDYKQKIEGVALTKASNSSSIVDGVTDIYGASIYANNEVNNDNYLSSAYIQYDVDNQYFYDNYLYNKSSRYEKGSLNYIRTTGYSLLPNYKSDTAYTIEADSIIADKAYKLNFNVEALDTFMNLVLTNSKLFENTATCARGLYNLVETANKNNLLTKLTNINESYFDRLFKGIAGFETYNDVSYFRFSSINSAFTTYYTTYFEPFVTSKGTFFNTFIGISTNYDSNVFGGDTLETNIDLFFKQALSSGTSDEWIEIIKAYYNFMTKIYYCEIDIPEIKDFYSNKEFNFEYYIGYTNPIAEVLTNTDNILFN